MSSEHISTTNEQRRVEHRPGALRRVAAVVGAPGFVQAIGRAALLPLAPDAHVVPVGLAERADARGRRGFDLVAPTSEARGELDLHEPELVVIARGRKDLPSRLFGSTAEKLARTAEHPVLVTRLPAERPYARVLVATDFSDACAKALQVASRVVTPESVEAWMLHVYDASYGLVLRVANAPIEKRLAYTSEVRARAAAGMADLLERRETAGWTFRTACVSGDPGSEIRRFVSTRGIELLVVGTCSPSDWGPPTLGSVAEACVRGVGCDVLLVPATRPSLH
jgi:nucleotide-binding universal stress UspA family protein